MLNWKLKGDIPVNLAGRVAFTAIILAFLLGIAASVLANTASTAFVPVQDTHPVSTSFDTEGCQIEEVVVAGRPPEVKAAVVSVPEPDIAMGINVLSDVPAFDWSYGCSATSAAMLFGYYDRTGYSNMYAGPTNSGVCPLDDTIWDTYSVSSQEYHECPLSATHQGIDGRASRGHRGDM